MAIINTDLRISDIFEKRRIDAEYFQPTFVANEKLVRGVKSGIKKLRYIAYITDGDHSTRKYTDKGIRFLTSENFEEFIIDYDTDKFISETYELSLLRSRSERDAIFVTKTGRYYGKAAICTSDTPLFNIPADVGKIRITNQQADPFFISAFLNSKYGHAEIRRENSGATRDRVTLINLGNVEIPLIASPEVKSTVLDCIKNYNLAKALYSQAQWHLESALGLDKVNFKKPVGYATRFSELELSRRMDAEHFYPEFEYIRSQIPSEVLFSRLGADMVFCQRGKQPVYMPSGLPVINSKHVQSNRVLLEGNRFALPNPILSLNIKYDDLLINGTGVGTIGRAAPYLREQAAVPDNHVTIIRLRTLDPVFVSVFLNSRIGQAQVRKFQRGSSGQIELYPHDIAKFVIWVAPESVQEKIHELIVNAHETHNRSQQLLEQAKARVEQLVEEAVKP